ncbi:hypothetical protein D1007_51802 [Hordeum vulgare]|uniref:Predicted protein n=1 Tax=Hordeum vulgare subsp. vulgare TaxID=112509 RepID=F2DSY5_HORVV|nr:F-box/FBD/LRR-repeat protein At1g51370-like [Hordeum vulgare subsp. vulgare]KAE8775685.1 hypothetical protein D1007_51802 [Hordeum vulgare]KAI4979704.1 hypothetical protein ZWY2020_016457 [Hordeum vulgare]BAJ98206.1 predicted protein [Hordeum vulgare subsp. vulgare]
MAGRAPYTNLDPVRAAGLQRMGFDPLELDRATEQLLTYVCTSLIPDFPFPATGRLVARPVSDGVDRISRLPRALLCNIVSRLPASDAARTAALSSRWRTIWLSTQPVLVDAYLRKDDYVWPPTPANSRAITAVVSRILEAHPGPFRCVHLACSHMNAYQAQLARWLQLLAAKGVQDLVLVNRPWPCDVILPDALFTINTLVRLYIGLWKLPDTARLGSYRTFPHLRELGICSVVMEQGDVDAIVARSPVLEVLSIQGSNKGLRLHLVSESLRCVQICGSVVEDIAMVKAPLLERLILHGCRDLAGGMCTRIRILDAPNLRVVGFLEPANHVLKIRDTIIRAGMKESTTTSLTSVKILSLNVRFGIRGEAEMVPRFLKCFPNVKTLHIMSGKCNQSTGTLNLKFKEVPMEISMSGISEMYFHEFRGDEGEVAFLKSLFKSAYGLEKAAIMMANPSLTPFSPDDALSKVKSELSISPGHVVVLVSGGPEGGRPWSFQKGTDFSCEDPFSVVAVSRRTAKFSATGAA